MGRHRRLPGARFAFPQLTGPDTVGRGRTGAETPGETLTPRRRVRSGLSLVAVDKVVDTATRALQDPSPRVLVERAGLARMRRHTEDAAALVGDLLRAVRSILLRVVTLLRRAVRSIHPFTSSSCRRMP